MQEHGLFGEKRKGVFVSGQAWGPNSLFDGFEEIGERTKRMCVQFRTERWSS